MPLANREKQYFFAFSVVEEISLVAYADTN